MKQLAVFVENREGRLDEALNILKDKDINIVSLSLADTTDYGLLRLIVSDAEAGKKALKERGFSAHVSEVIGVRLAHEPGTLQSLLAILSKANINIEYMYALCTKTDEAALVFKTSDSALANEVLTKEGIKLFSDEDVF